MVHELAEGDYWRHGESQSPTPFTNSTLEDSEAYGQGRRCFSHRRDQYIDEANQQ
jgi:hypothetical protein